MAALGPFSFEPADSPARRLHPLAKLAALLCLSLASTAGNALLLPVLAPLSFAALAAAGAFRNGVWRGLGTISRNAHFLVPIAIFVILFRVLDFWRVPVLDLGQLPPALLYLARLVVVFLVAEAFFRSTSSAELASAATLAARRILGREDIDPGLYLSMAVGFIPRCFESWSRTREAAQTRGHGKGASLRSSLALLEAFLASGIRAALETSEALDARCYSPSRSHERTRFGSRDWLLVALASCLLVVSALA